MNSGSIPLVSKIWRPFATALLVAFIVFCSSLLGILTRPLGFLAAFWPANAILLGIMVRWPRLASPAGWFGAIGGYFAADLITGGTLIMTTWLTAGNLAGVVTGYLLFGRCQKGDLQLQSPHSVLRLFVVCGGAALMAAVVGSGSAPLIFGKSWEEAFGFWFSTELVNSMVVLPVLFTAPFRSLPRITSLSSAMKQWRWPSLFPLTALLGSVLAGQYVGGPGAIAFTIPSLVWCALSYRLFTSVLLTLLLCMWLLIAVSGGFLRIPMNEDYLHSMTSLRLGITLLALGPLTVASINRARNDLMERLHDIAVHDDLTRAMSRKAFFDKGAELLSRCVSEKRPMAVLMLDIDDFKHINDLHGHGAGDRCLASFASVAMEALREHDVFGRLGGDEFGVILPGASPVEATEVADRILRQAKGMTVVLENGKALKMNVSIGSAIWSEGEAETLDAMFSLADDALYEAKKKGC